jgi:hypothetical protein
MKTRLLLLSSLSAVVGATTLTVPAFACCAMGLDDVFFGSQKNIIIWNPATKMQHFVRKADFVTESKDMGFIAPTPSIPELAEANEKAFDLLPSWPELNPSKSDGADTASAAAAESVEVIQKVNVAGYEATTLKANDAGALAAYMKANGYKTNPGIEKWTAYYIKKGWMLTAFKVKSKDGRATTGLVRMSFKTDKPFNPYYVPKENQNGGAGLEVYFFSNEPYLPTVGQSGTFKPVQAEVTEVDRIKLSAIASNLKIKLPYVQGLTTVSMFRDETFPNAATDDLFFTPSVQFAKANLDQMSAIQAVSTSIKAPESALSPFLGAGVAVLVGAGVTAFLMRRKS